MFEVKDRDPSRGAAADRREEQLAWAEEVLVTKAALEEKHQRIADLESQVRLHLPPPACPWQVPGRRAAVH